MHSQLKFVFWNPWSGSGSFCRDITTKIFPHVQNCYLTVNMEMKCYQKHYSALLLREGRFYTEDWSSLQKINHIARWVFQTTWAIILLCCKHCKSVHICRLWCQGGVGEKNKQVLVLMQMKKCSFQNPLIPYQPGQILSLCVVIATEAWSTHWRSLHF